MHTLRAHTQPIELKCDLTDEKLTAQFNNLAVLTNELIEAVGIKDALHFDYNASGVAPAKRLALYSSNQPQYLRICRNSDQADLATGWDVEAQFASKPTGAHKWPTECRLGVLSMVDYIVCEVLDSGSVAVNRLSRSLEHLPHIVSGAYAERMYEDSFAAVHAVRSVAAGIRNVKRRGVQTDWRREEWALH